MKAKVDIDAVIGGVRIHVKAGDQLPQALIDHWLVSNSMVRAIRQGLVEDDDDPAPIVAPPSPKKPKPVPAMAVAEDADL